MREFIVLLDRIVIAVSFYARSVRKVNLDDADHRKVTFSKNFAKLD